MKSKWPLVIVVGFVVVMAVGVLARKQPCESTFTCPIVNMFKINSPVEQDANEKQPDNNEPDSAK